MYGVSSVVFFTVLLREVELRKATNHEIQFWKTWGI